MNIVRVLSDLIFGSHSSVTDAAILGKRIQEKSQALGVLGVLLERRSVTERSHRFYGRSPRHSVGSNRVARMAGNKAKTGKLKTNPPS